MLKLYPKTVDILKPEEGFLQATNKISISPKFLTISSGIVRQMGLPEYVRIYLDRKQKLLFLVPCSKDVEGARKFYKPSAKQKTVNYGSPKLCRLLAKIAGIDLKENNGYFVPEEVEGRENAIGFNLAKGEAVKLPTAKTDK